MKFCMGSFRKGLWPIIAALFVVNASVVSANPFDKRVEASDGENRATAAWGKEAEGPYSSQFFPLSQGVTDYRRGICRMEPRFVPSRVVAAESVLFRGAHRAGQNWPAAESCDCIRDDFG